MNVAILAGGRGRRLGLLTQSTQKAVLCFNGNPLISHVLKTVLQEPMVEDVVVLTGYRGNDVHKTVNMYHSDEMKTSRIRILDFPDIRGTLSRFASALPYLSVTTGWCICGIDSLVPHTVFQRFCSFVALRREEIR